MSYFSLLSLFSLTIFDLFNNINFVLSTSYPAMTCRWTDYNGWDASSTVNSYTEFLAGQQSYHNNGYEDRRYKWKYCKHNNDNNENLQIGNDIELYETKYDDWFRRGCGGNTALNYIYSKHDNGVEDRQFNFKCSEINNKYRLTSCDWTNWLNDFDGSLSYSCNNNGLIRTVESYHNNNNEDRRWKFECCRLAFSEYEDELIDMKCFNSGYYENDFDGNLKAVQDEYFFSGMNSIHNNGNEDRRFKFRYCKPNENTNPITSTDLLTITAWDEEWTRSCEGYNSGNSGIVGITSKHDNGKEDRQYTITCGKLDTSRYGLTNCGWTGDISNYDQVNNYNCPGNGIIRGIWSKHNNHFEDRIFRFECCNLVTNKFSDISGKWANALSCKGCKTIEHEVSVGISNSRSESTTKEYRQELGVSISAGYSYSFLGASSASIEVTVSSSFAWATATTIETSLTKETITTQTVSCDKTYLFQWRQEATDYLAGVGSQNIVLYSQDFLCTDNPYPSCPLGWCDNDDCDVCRDGFNPTS